MKSIKVLDVTLRDGGCVNNFNFGQSYMDKILGAQEESRVEIIELGYLDEMNGSTSGRTQYLNEQVIIDCILKDKKVNTSYVVMMDYGKFDVDKLSPRTHDGIDGIRLAFHKKNRKEILDLGRKIIDKGYDLYVQPMITLRYSDAELIDLIEDVNRELPDATAFYIVDSFGEMRENDMNRVLNLVDHNLIRNMSIGFHSHNNLQLSYSNAVALLKFPSDRNMILDSSIMGMGKGAGNLNTEILVEHLNLYYGKEYRIEPLLDVIDTVINQIHSEFYWGYAVEYYLSSTNHCTPSYASYFFNKHMLPVAQVNELLQLIDENKKISFDKEYAERLYLQYNERTAVDDTLVIKEIRDILLEKTVLIVAPGKSIIDASERIEKLIAEEDIISIGLNTIISTNFDFIVTTRKEVYDEAIRLGKNIICPSNISKGGRVNVRVLDYSKWIKIDENGKIHDSSFVIITNLLINIGVRKVMLAGFDGFSLNMNENYFNSDLRRPLDYEGAEQRNQYQRKIVEKMMKSGIEVEFVTKSEYIM